MKKFDNVALSNLNSTDRSTGLFFCNGLILYSLPGVLYSCEIAMLKDNLRQQSGCLILHVNIYLTKYKQKQLASVHQIQRSIFSILCKDNTNLKCHVFILTYFELLGSQSRILQMGGQVICIYNVSAALNFILGCVSLPVSGVIAHLFV